MDALPLDLWAFFDCDLLGRACRPLSGFAFGLVAASVWLYILTPLQTATLIVAFGLIVQGYAVWKLRQALDWRRLWPFVAGAAAGVPAGVGGLTWASPAYVRAGVGVLLVLYSLYGWFRPSVKPIAAGPAADIAVGFSNGALVGLTRRHPGDDLVWCARLAERSATRRVPARRGGDLRHDR
jgi:uncharacterized membrane protein YfcA